MTRRAAVACCIRAATVGVLILTLAPACRLIEPFPTPVPTITLPPLATPALLLTPTHPVTPPPTPEPADTGWEEIAPGVELRHMRVHVHPGTEPLTIVRLEPSAVRFRVVYDPDGPRTVAEWAGADQPLLVINGGFFTPENETIGLLITRGWVWGALYGEHAGMFAVRADGQVSVRWLAKRPYDPGEPLVEAVQSFPILVKPGGRMAYPDDAEEGPPARRTVVAQDRRGRILFIVAPRGRLSLVRLGRFLADSDLNLDIALNLDGGRSTGLYLTTDGTRVEIDSLVPVPSAIVVERR